MKTIKFWSNKEVPYGLFSNFANTPIVIDGINYPTVEHYYQAKKATNSLEWKKIVEASTPLEAKRLGHKVHLCESWEINKCAIMMRGLQEKARQCEEFKILLAATGDAELIEDSPLDYYWGCGRDGSGRNMLGELLETVREMIKSGEL